MTTHAEKSVSHYAEFVRLLRELHRLIREGKGDSPESDVHRDEMDVHWPHLTASQIELTKGLSAALYSLTGNELYSPEDTVNPVSKAALQAAWEAEDFESVLRLLHRPALFLRPDEIAFMRAHCWSQLGDLETALLFYQRASELLPDDEQYTAMLMLTCLSLGKLADARSCAARLADNSTVTLPIILLRAAGVLYASLDEVPSPGSSGAMARVVELIERAFEMDKKLPFDHRLSDQDRAQYLAVAAVCNIELGQRHLAAKECEEALRLNPHNELAITAQAALANGQQPTGRAVVRERSLRSQVEATERQDLDRVYRNPFLRVGV